jgi:carbon storage regulator
MLVITRRPGDFVQIGDDIRIHFFGFVGAQMKIGIEAPRDVNIARGELIESWSDDDELADR